MCVSVRCIFLSLDQTWNIAWNIFDDFVMDESVFSIRESLHIKTCSQTLELEQFYLRLLRSVSYLSGRSFPSDLYTITTATGRGAAGSRWRRLLSDAVVTSS